MMLAPAGDLEQVDGVEPVGRYIDEIDGSPVSGYLRVAGQHVDAHHGNGYLDRLYAEPGRRIAPIDHVLDLPVGGVGDADAPVGVAIVYDDGVVRPDVGFPGPPWKLHGPGITHLGKHVAAPGDQAEIQRVDVMVDAALAVVDPQRARVFLGPAAQKRQAVGVQQLRLAVVGSVGFGGGQLDVRGVGGQHRVLAEDGAVFGHQDPGVSWIVVEPVPEGIGHQAAIVPVDLVARLLRLAVDVAAAVADRGQNAPLVPGVDLEIEQLADLGVAAEVGESLRRDVPAGQRAIAFDRGDRGHQVEQHAGVAETLEPAAVGHDEIGHHEPKLPPAIEEPLKDVGGIRMLAATEVVESGGQQHSSVLRIAGVAVEGLVDQRLGHGAEQLILDVLADLRAGVQFGDLAANEANEFVVVINGVEDDLIERGHQAGVARLPHRIADQPAPSFVLTRQAPVAFRGGVGHLLGDPRQKDGGLVGVLPVAGLDVGHGQFRQSVPAALVVHDLPLVDPECVVGGEQILRAVRTDVSLAVVGELLVGIPLAAQRALHLTGVVDGIELPFIVAHDRPVNGTALLLVDDVSALGRRGHEQVPETLIVESGVFTRIGIIRSQPGQFLPGPQRTALLDRLGRCVCIHDADPDCQKYDKSNVHRCPPYPPPDKSRARAGRSSILALMRKATHDPPARRQCSPRIGEDVHHYGAGPRPVPAWSFESLRSYPPKS